MSKRLFACLVACAMLWVGAARDQAYPSQTVRSIVPAAAGGADVVARLVAAQV